MNDKELFQRLLKNDEQAYELVYKLYRGDFVQWFRGKFNVQQDDALEIFQSAIVILYENINSGKFKELTSSLKTYIFSIGRNLGMELARYKKKKQTQDNLFEKLVLEEKQDKSELFKKVNQAIAQLDDTCREVILSHYFEGLNSVQLAEKMGYKNADTAKTKKYKCMQKLMQLINPDKK